MRMKLVLLGSLVFLLSVQSKTAAPAIPNPVIAFMGTELVEVGGKQFTRYHYDVVNKSAFPRELFATAPNLPPCGNNKNSPRTWIDIYEKSGKRLNGFCTVTDPTHLTKLWFALETGEMPPSWIYIELTDRQTNMKYKSNLAETAELVSASVAPSFNFIFGCDKTIRSKEGGKSNDVN